MKSSFVSKLNVTRGDETGEINLSWDSVKNAELYVIQFSTAKNRQAIKDEKSDDSKINNAGWETADIINESKYTIKGLREKKTYLFRVAAVTTSKQGPWSRTVRKEI